MSQKDRKNLALRRRVSRLRKELSQAGKAESQGDGSAEAQQDLSGCRYCGKGPTAELRIGKYNFIRCEGCGSKWKAGGNG